jgi:hypothetical protein
MDERHLNDEELVRAIFDACDDASRLARQATEVAISLDRLASATAERWAPDALAQIDERERLELHAERRR